METKKITFWNLLKECKVNIPIIQRDYAQGRIEEKVRRDNFLDSIFKHLNESVKMDLDFVYGKEVDNVFFPIDGQQRLTTLFLLHWYFAVKENQIATAKETLIQFTYDTRISSREFCKAIVENEIVLFDELASSITNKFWFREDWKNDPTIKAMLVMIQAIHEKFNDKKFWTNLVDEGLITFHILDLGQKGFKLTDELYIKMNARGKQLTAFENFKADLTKWMKDETNEQKDELEKKVDYKGRKMSYYMAISQKMDNEWTDLFWKYKNEIDDSYMKFIANVAMFLYATEKSTKTEDRIQALFNNPDKVNSSDFASEDKFNTLTRYLDLYANTTNKFDEKTVNNLWNSENNLFNQILSDKTTYPQRVLFYAQTVFFANNFSTGFEDWMRVVRNILQNSTVDSSSTFVGAINLINEIPVGANETYNWLSNNSVKSSFAKKQLEEEIVKSKIIIQSEENKTSIHQIEDTNFCKGRIDFALYCIDSNNESKIGNFTSQKLNSIKTVFDNHLNEDDISNDFRRAMFTIGNNDFYEYWKTSTSYILGYDKGIPKRCAIESTNDLKEHFAYSNNPFVEYLKELVNKLIKSDLSTTINDFQCPNDMPNWKQRLIKEKNLLDKHCEGHYFGITQDNSCCYLFECRKKPNSKSDCFKVK